VYAFRAIDVALESYDVAFAHRVIESFSEEQRDELLEHRLVPVSYEIDLDRDALKLILAADDPSHSDLQRSVHSFGLDNFEVCYAPDVRLIPILERIFPKKNEFLDRIKRDKSAEAFDIGATFDEGSQDLVDEEALDAEINRSSLINLVEAALVEAVRQSASDIHIYPNALKQTEFHFRIDGELQLWNTQTKVSPEAMIAVVKDRCGNVDRFEREAAQDGYIQRTVDGTLIRYRVSVLPIATANRDIKAESVVIRVLDDRNVFSDLSSIGLLEGALERYRKSIQKPHGMIIMTGPTGSGKSTTLVAALQELVRPQVNVLTIEDPVEYIIPGVRQIKLGSRLGMEAALRSILRHDPDIVMVGEMRDKETAELAIKLANTGHLTFSTLHTNDAPSAISRLYKLGIEPFLLAYAINLVVAQRLLRKLCTHCKMVDHDADPVLLTELGFDEAEVARTTFYKPAYVASCPKCKGVGYRGRRAIGEALYFTRAIRHNIVGAGSSVDEEAIRKTAVSEGMLTLLASAREVVKLGETSVEEVIRVTASDE
jgi:type IV pilus assembly protein PilB